jgi:16S rRNA (guanine527-N7)-methyltransferase
VAHPRRARDPLPTRISDTPPLPPSFERVLDAGLGALGLRLTESARTAIEGQARLLFAWTSAINLTAIRDPDDVARLHVLDSLAAVPLLRSRSVAAFVDLGSGGGYPGVPLAAALERPALLVDSIAKKARFLEVVTRAVGLDRSEHGAVEVRATRAEALGSGPDRERWPCVVARAVGPLDELAELALPLLSVGSVLVAWKRGMLDDELDAAASRLHDLGAGEPALHDVDVPGLEGHRLVVVEKVAPTSPRYPRDPAVRRRDGPGRAREGIR